MRIEKLFDTQMELRKRIIEEHDLEGEDLRPNFVLALAVELAELANETRCFKHWSKKPPSEKKVILEEYVDVLHFILELGLSEFEQYGERYMINSFLDSDIESIEFNSLTEQFNGMFTEIGILNDSLFEDAYSVNSVEDTYNNLVRLFYGLGEMLGFSWEEIEQAYYEKNKINHQRQDQGY